MKRLNTGLILFICVLPNYSFAQKTIADVMPTPDILDFYSHFMFSLNHTVYQFLDDTSARLFGSPQKSITPSQPGQIGNLGNMAINIVNEPITIASGLLIGDWSTALVAAQRFGINSTVGLLGWYDTATTWGYSRRELDLGLVLCAYGINAGPYLVIPFIGPRTARDAFTDIILTNAILWTTMWMLLPPSAGLWAIVAAEGVEVIAEIAATRQIDSSASKLSFTDYEAMRTKYLENRLARCNQVRNISVK